MINFGGIDSYSIVYFVLGFFMGSALLLLYSKITGFPYKPEALGNRKVRNLKPKQVVIVVEYTYKKNCLKREIQFTGTSKEIAAVVSNIMRNGFHYFSEFSDSEDEFCRIFIPVHNIVSVNVAFESDIGFDEEINCFLEDRLGSPTF